jgi:hypothetical protein
MEQNNTLKRYLIIGLIISMFGTLISCKGEEFFAQTTAYHFVNDTNYNISYDSGLEKYNVTAKSTTVLKQFHRGGGSNGESAPPLYNHPFFEVYGKKINIKFNNVKCLLDVKVDDAHSIMDLKNYTVEKIDNFNYKLTYTFTEADYNRAVTCP